MILGTVFLGYAYEPVLEAVRAELIRVVNFVRPSIFEGELAELLHQVIPSAEMVKFGEIGPDAVTVATRLARAYTIRDIFYVVILSLLMPSMISLSAWLT